jgi:uncharacterized membrane protein YeiH
VFWIRDQMFFIASLGSAIAIFITARLVTVPPRFFLVADAAGLATFAIAGTLVSLMVGASPLVASFMGVMTGTMGGIFRDVLCGEPPVVFHSPLYATVSWGGADIPQHGHHAGGDHRRGWHIYIAPAGDPLRHQPATVSLQTIAGYRPRFPVR